MSENWYFARAGKQFGPFSGTQLKGFAATAFLRPEDTVWKEGMTQGVLAAKVRQLFPPPQAPAPPAPPGGPTVAVPFPARSPLRRRSSLPPLLAAAAVPPPRPPTAQAPAPAPGVGIWDDLELVPIEEDTPARAVALAPPRTQGRVLGMTGGVLVSQNGVAVKYRKKCRHCGHTDAELTTMPIRPGSTGVNFYCLKCGAHQQVEVRAER